MSMGYVSPTSGPGGDNDEDDAAASALWRLEGSHGIWTPECWRKSPVQLQEEARSMNESAFAGAALNARKHSNPPNMPNRMRPF